MTLVPALPAPVPVPSIAVPAVLVPSVVTLSSRILPALTFGGAAGLVMAVAGVLAVLAALAVLPAHVFVLVQLARVGSALAPLPGCVPSTSTVGRPVRVGATRIALLS